MRSPIAAAAILLAAIPLAAEADSPTLTLAAQSRSMIWNAVAVEHGQVFVAGPRWTGSEEPALDAQALDVARRAVRYVA